MVPLSELSGAVWKASAGLGQGKPVLKAKGQSDFRLLREGGSSKAEKPGAVRLRGSAVRGRPAAGGGSALSYQRRREAALVGCIAR